MDGLGMAFVVIFMVSVLPGAYIMGVKRGRLEARQQRVTHGWVRK